VRVLLVEDNELNREVILYLLANIALLVNSMGDWIEAVERLCRQVESFEHAEALLTLEVLEQH